MDFTKYVLMQRVLQGFIVLFSMAAATVNSSYIDSDGWESSGSIFRCQISRDVYDQGRAMFERRAGEDLRFYLASTQNFARATHARLLARTPVWIEQPQAIAMGNIELESGAKPPVQVATELAESMMSELFYGRDVVLQLRGHTQPAESRELLISTVGFRPAYREYHKCLQGLLPVNFQQVERTAVYFGPGRHENIELDELERLADAILYAKADSRVKRIYVDGHTDNTGFRKGNLELSQHRAEEVVEFLVEKGVPEKLIVSRWHGERYPAASNSTELGRAKNRRVTIRLERVELVGRG